MIEQQEINAGEEKEEDIKGDETLAAVESEECLVLGGDSDPNVLVVNSETEVVPSHPAQSPKFEIITEDTKPEADTKEPEESVIVAEPVVEKTTEAAVEEETPAPVKVEDPEAEVKEPAATANEPVQLEDATTVEHDSLEDKVGTISRFSSFYKRNLMLPQWGRL